ncbi:MAG: hypothetical protein ACI9GM_000162 [Salibacteraceae bacterium]|jgi:hypothetical protein
MAVSTAVKDIISGLKSSEEVDVNKALTQVRSKGNTTLIPILIDLWEGTNNQKIKKEVESILFGLKEMEALDFLVTYIATDVMEQKKWLALNAIWQSGFNASKHLTALVDFAISNSYTNAIDIMTIIDNSDFDEKEEQLADTNILRLNDYLLKNKSDNLQVLLEIRSILIDKKIEG